MQGAPQRTPRLFVIDVGLDDPRLDQHLSHRHIQLPHQSPQLGESVGRLVGHQGVGPWVDTQAAAPGENALVGERGQQQLCHVRRLGVMDRQQLTPHGLQLRIQRLPRPGFTKLLCQLRDGRDHQNVTLLAPGQSFAAQYKVQRLIPGHVFRRKVRLPCTVSLATG